MNSIKVIKTKATVLQQFLILCLMVVILTCDQVSAQSCRQYFEYYSLSKDELKSLQDLAYAEINANGIQKPNERLARLSQINELKKIFAHYGISNSVYIKVLREVYHLITLENFVDTARKQNTRQQRETFEQLFEQKTQQEEEINSLLEKYDVQTLTEALYKASSNDNANDIVKILETSYLFEKLDLASRDGYGTVLHIAAEYGSAELVKSLVYGGLDVNDNKFALSKQTPLDRSYSNKDNFFTLLELKGKSSDAGDLLRSALMYDKTDFDVLMYLIQHIINVNDMRGSLVRLPLLFYMVECIQIRAKKIGAQDISVQDAQLLQALLDKGANPFRMAIYDGIFPMEDLRYLTIYSLIKEAQAKWVAAHKDP